MALTLTPKSVPLDLLQRASGIDAQDGLTDPTTQAILRRLSLLLSASADAVERSPAAIVDDVVVDHGAKPRFGRREHLHREEIILALYSVASPRADGEAQEIVDARRRLRQALALACWRTSNGDGSGGEDGFYADELQRRNHDGGGGGDGAFVRRELQQLFDRSFDAVLRVWCSSMAGATDEPPPPPRSAEELVAAVARAQARAERSKEELERLEARGWHRRWELCRLYRELYDNLSRFGGELCERRLPQAELARGEQMLATARALAAKLRLLRTQLVRETYTPAHVAALRRVRRAVDHEHIRASRAHAHAEVSRRRYELAARSSELRALAEEYGHELERVKHLKWSLQRLQE